MNGLTGILRVSLAVVAVGGLLVAAPIVHAGFAPVRPSVEGVDATAAQPEKMVASLAEGLDESGQATVVPTPSTLPRQPEPILAFVSRRSGSDQVVTATGDDSGRMQLTVGGRTLAPTWLGPTGGLACARTSSDLPQGDLVARSPDSRERIVSGNAARPSSSPVGTRLVYESTEPSPASRFFLLNVDGTGKRQLTNSTCFSAQPWSPDGMKIVFGISVAIVRATSASIR